MPEKIGKDKERSVEWVRGIIKSKLEVSQVRRNGSMIIVKIEGEEEKRDYEK